MMMMVKMANMAKADKKQPTFIQGPLYASSFSETELMGSKIVLMIQFGNLKI